MRSWAASLVGSVAGQGGDNLRGRLIVFDDLVGPSFFETPIVVSGLPPPLSPLHEPRQHEVGSRGDGRIVVVLQSHQQQLRIQQTGGIHEPLGQPQPRTIGQGMGPEVVHKP